MRRERACSGWRGQGRSEMEREGIGEREGDGRVEVCNRQQAERKEAAVEGKAWPVEKVVCEGGDECEVD